MKKLLIIAILLIGFSSAYAADHSSGNPIVVSDPFGLSARIFTPLSIVPQDIPDLPPVIKGQKREFAGDEVHRLIFKLYRDPGDVEPDGSQHGILPPHAFISFNCPQPVEGVVVSAFWYWHDTPPPWAYDWSGLQINQAFYWEGPQYEAWADLEFRYIDATAATSTGRKMFTVNVTGYYDQL